MTDIGDQLESEVFRLQALVALRETEIERLRNAVAYLRDKAVGTHGDDPYVYIWQCVWDEFERRVSE